MKEQDTYMIKINLPGGIVPAGELLDILTIVQNVGVETVRFGNRQQLLFSVAATELEELKNDLLISDFNYEVDREDHPNIISSYVTEDIIYNAHWLKEGVYKDIIDLFNYEPRLKINLVDNSQTFVPFFTGNINFISSEVSNYWYLYVRFPKTNILYCWPSLVYSDDIPGISKLIEAEILSHRSLYYDQPLIDGDILHKAISKKAHFVLQPHTQQLQLPDFHLPFYEGFNRYGNNRLWLGIYRRDETFPTAFLKDLCQLCLQTRIGQLYTTPWKSIVIKGIDQADRNYWGNILNRYRINVRHAANELNWQVDELCEEGLDIKRQLVREFEEADTRTYRLCFAVKIKPKSGLFGSVFINKQKGKRTFDILYTRDFNPNSKIFTIYKSNVKREQLSGYLIQLCDHFYALQDSSTTAKADAGVVEFITLPHKQVHQCSQCLTIYNDIYGDELSGIAPGTAFELINNYNCPTCGAAKNDFVIIDEPAYL
ncbi:rubredoxin [Mucilaginibacter sp. AW1-3]